MTTYADAPFTLDPSVPIVADAPPCITYNGADADALKAAADTYYTEAAGPLSLSTTTVSELVIEATLSGVQSEAVFDWGDGQVDVVVSADQATAVATHTYSVYGTFALAGYARVDTVDYVVGVPVTTEPPVVTP